MTNDYLIKCCRDLDLLLQSGAWRDINGVGLQTLHSELLILRDYMKANGLEGVTALDALICIHRNAATFPNLCIALRIFLTTPVTVAKAKRSFSKLELLKTYLRTSMSQQRLRNLAIISIEKDTVNRLNCSNVIKDSVSKKVRNVFF
jgi:hypothetical protein